MSADEDVRSVELTRKVGALMEQEPDQDLRFAALTMNLANEISRIRIEDRGRCQHDIALMIDKYVHKIAVLR